MPKMFILLNHDLDEAQKTRLKRALVWVSL